MTNKLTGLILSGGKSKRAGTDKGLKMLDGNSWVQIMQHKLLHLGLQVSVSINLCQLDKYQIIIDEKSIIIDDATIPGPLRGILTAHHHYPDSDWLVLACDQIDMQPQVIEKLMFCFNKNRGFDFYVYKNEKHYQPFCGIYTAKGLQKLLKMYRTENEENYSMQHVFDSYKTFTIPVSAQNQSFNNYNT